MLGVIEGGVQGVVNIGKPSMTSSDFVLESGS